MDPTCSEVGPGQHAPSLARQQVRWHYGAERVLDAARHPQETSADLAGVPRRWAGSGCAGVGGRLAALSRRRAAAARPAADVSVRASALLDRCAEAGHARSAGAREGGPRRLVLRARLAPVGAAVTAIRRLLHAPRWMVFEEDVLTSGLGARVARHLGGSSTPRSDHRQVAERPLVRRAVRRSLHGSIRARRLNTTGPCSRRSSADRCPT